MAGGRVRVYVKKDVHGAENLKFLQHYQRFISEIFSILFPRYSYSRKV